MKSARSGDFESECELKEGVRSLREEVSKVISGANMRTALELAIGDRNVADWQDFEDDGVWNGDSADGS